MTLFICDAEIVKRADFFLSEFFFEDMVMAFFFTQR